jgi:hypothetical protein
VLKGLWWSIQDFSLDTILMIYFSMLVHILSIPHYHSIFCQFYIISGGQTCQFWCSV